MHGIIESIQRKEVQGIGSCPWRCGENPLIGKKNWRHRPLFILLRTDAKDVASAWNSAHAMFWRYPMSSTERDITPLSLRNRWPAWVAISVKRCALNSQFFVKIQRNFLISWGSRIWQLMLITSTRTENLRKIEPIGHHTLGTLDHFRSLQTFIYVRDKNWHLRLF